METFPLVFRGSDAVACGVLTRAQLRGPAVQRLCQGIYTVATRSVTHESRCRAEALAAHRAGLDVRRTKIETADWTPWADGKPATPMRMAPDLLLGRPLPEAVADLDAVLRAKLIDRAALAAMEARQGDNGIVAARRAVGLANPEAAQSLPELVLRVRLELAGSTPVPGTGWRIVTAGSPAWTWRSPSGGWLRTVETAPCRWL